MEYFIITVLVGLSAVFSGLTLGFFSLDKDDLARKAGLGDKRAKKVYQIRKRGNLLLCTLLIGNVAVNSTLSVFLGSITPGFIAGLTATGLIVIFGEIIPQAVFSRYAMIAGAKLAWLVKFFVVLLFPICWPLSWLLDKALGEEMPNVYSKGELMKIIEDHEELKESDIDADEERIVKGALSFSEEKVHEVMTPRTEIFSLPDKQTLDKKIIQAIFRTGHSRIPVYSGQFDNIVGILYVKDLIMNNFGTNKKVGDIMRTDLFFVDYNKPLDEVLNAFRSKRQHLFIVLNEYGSVSGIITIEDVLEEIIGAEIVDEYDKCEDLQARARDKMKKRKINRI